MTQMQEWWDELDLTEKADYRNSQLQHDIDLNNERHADGWRNEFARNQERDIQLELERNPCLTYEQAKNNVILWN